jgi:hypothetical protein
MLKAIGPVLSADFALGWRRWAMETISRWSTPTTLFRPGRPLPICRRLRSIH